ncbi:hypothetical protein DIPPA_05258, partial [Diplonema papillatum]
DGMLYGCFSCRLLAGAVELHALPRSVRPHFQAVVDAFLADCPHLSDRPPMFCIACVETIALRSDACSACNTSRVPKRPLQAALKKDAEGVKEVSNAIFAKNDFIALLALRSTAPVVCNPCYQKVRHLLLTPVSPDTNTTPPTLLPSPDTNATPPTVAARYRPRGLVLDAEQRPAEPPTVSRKRRAPCPSPHPPKKRRAYPAEALAALWHENHGRNRAVLISFVRKSCGSRPLPAAVADLFPPSKRERKTVMQEVRRHVNDFGKSRKCFLRTLVSDGVERVSVMRVISSFWEVNAVPIVGGVRLRLHDAETGEKAPTDEKDPQKGWVLKHFCPVPFGTLYRDFVNWWEAEAAAKGWCNLRIASRTTFLRLRPHWVCQTPKDPRIRCPRHHEAQLCLDGFARWDKFSEHTAVCDSYAARDVHQLDDGALLPLLCLDNVPDVSRVLAFGDDDNEGEDKQEEEQEETITPRSLSPPTSPEEHENDTTPVLIGKGNGAFAPADEETVTYKVLVAQKKKVKNKTTGKPQDVTVWEVEERCASLIEYRMILKDQMKKYKDHHDTDLNQKASLKELETRLRVDQAILFFDYSAKYISQIHEGPQQIAYGQQRMSMLVFIIRKLDPAYLPDKRVFRSHCVFYLSDDTKEDSFQA